MYKMIIADDEPLIRSGLKNLIEWEVYGIEIIAEAEDGLKAYLAIKSLEPHLALIDISMPNMSGIELLEMCSNLEHCPKFIILSGYNDFQFVQKSMQLGAVNYLLKPVDLEELVQTIENTIHMLDDIQAKKLQFQESLDALRNTTLTRILHNRIESRELREKCQLLNISFHCSHMRVGIVKPVIDRNEPSLRAKIFSAIECCEKIFSSLCPCYVMADMEDNIAIIFKDMTNTLTEKHYHEALDICENELSLNLGFPLYTALGPIASIVPEISLSYQACLLAIEKKVITGTSLDDNINIDGLTFPNIDASALLDCLTSKDPSKIQEFIHAYFSAILHQNQNHTNIDMVKYYLIEFVTCAMQKLHSAALSEPDIRRQKLTAFSIISETNSLSLLEEKLTLFFVSLTEYHTNIPTNTNYSFMIQTALSYLHNNYQDCNLSLKTLAVQLEVNAAYLGRQFALETGEYFTDYLNRIRIAKAINLLHSTTWKTAKIAETVGFANISYFFTIYKKVTGERPGDNRKKTSV